MKLQPRSLKILLIIIYLAFMLFAAYTLFQLQDDLVYTSRALSISDVRAAGPVFVKLNLVVGSTLLLGLGILVFLFKSKSEDVIYVEKKRVAQKNEDEDGGEDSEGEDDGEFSTAFLNNILKSETDEQKLLDKSLNAICKKIEAGIGVIYSYEKDKNKKTLQLKSSYALSLGESQTLKFELGEGLVGQAAKEKKAIIIDDIPEGHIKIVSGLGSSSPRHLIVHPLEMDKKLFGVIEIATFTQVDKQHKAFIQKCMDKVMSRIQDNTSKTTKKSSAKKEAPKKETKGKTKKA